MKRTDWCPVTGKQKFGKRSDALKAVNRYRASHISTLSIYFCRECKTYHITHYPYALHKNWGRGKNNIVREDGTYAKRNKLIMKHRRYGSNKFPVERGKYNFLKLWDTDPELVEMASNGNAEAFAKRIGVEAVNLDGSEGCHVGMAEWMTDSEYYSFWDTEVDKRGLFRDGHPTIEALQACGGCPNENHKHRTDEQKQYEEVYQQALIDEQRAAEMEDAATRLNLREDNAYYDTAEKIREQRGISADNEYKAMQQRERELISAKLMVKDWYEEQGELLMKIYLAMLHK